MSNEFTHLHVHTEYSLLDGSAKIKDLIARAKELGMKSIAITDHGFMYGTINFYREAIANDIKPILGCETYLASGSRFNKTAGKDNFYYHLVLLAENNVGWHNLIKLTSAAALEGFYYRPRIDLELLREHHDGLICLSACTAGPVARNILNGNHNAACDFAMELQKIFGAGNFYLEVQNHELDDEKTARDAIIKLSNELNIPLVCTNDVHYIYEDDYKSHDVLLCIQTGKTVNDPNRMRYGTNQLYLKSADEMHELFIETPEAIANTNAIAKRCNVELTFDEYKLPKYCDDAPTFLSQLCKESIGEFYHVTDEIFKRLDYELTTINQMGFADYFLIVWDFIRYAKQNGIAVGPGRGSAAGSIVAYCLGITTIDPIKYNLFFERFLNPERVTMPDIDVDFCYERRQEVIDYVIEKYGAEHVSQIITFGTMAARAVIRDVARAMDISYSTADRIAKMIPVELGITITKAIESNSELSELYRTDELIKTLLDMSIKLEGLPRHASIHAAGVLICDEPVIEHVPLTQNDGVVSTQFTMNTIADLGLLKMDFLGLRTLTVIQNTLRKIKTPRQMDLADANVYELISTGKTAGVFQLESNGMRQFMKDLQPKTFDDIVAGIALYRPGPMDFIPKYIAGKKGNAKYIHPMLETILQSTYGCIVYQEQVMQIVRDLAGYSFGQSDIVRRAMSKKKADVMERERHNFVYGDDKIPGCIANGIEKEIAEKIFDEMIDFAKYAFNKSHAVSYAMLSFQTAWLKCYYPVEFMAALLTSVSDTKIPEYIAECKDMNILLLPPDINKSFSDFTTEGGNIRFGLLAIKNVGKNLVAAIISERSNGKFKSFSDFAERIQTNDLNKRSIEFMIKAGLFDSLGGKRSQYLYVYKQILNGIAQTKRSTISGQVSMFDVEPIEELPELAEYPLKELLTLEKEVLGIYISGHPLDEYKQQLQKHVSMNSIDNAIDGKVVTVGGLVIDKQIKITKSKRTMMFITLEDLFGVIEIILFPNVYEKYLDQVFYDSVIVIKGKVSARENESVKIICDSITKLS